MKKVLYTATLDSHILQFHLPFLKLLKENGYEVHVATNSDKPIPYCDKKHKICIKRSPYSYNNIKAIKELRKIIDSEKFNIIHCHTPMGSVVTRLASKKARKKFKTRVIYTAHGFHFYKGAPLLNWILFYPVERFLSKYTDTLITINKEDFMLAKKKFKKCKNIQYIPGVGIDINKFNFLMSKKEKHDLRKSLGLKEKDFIIIFPAELNKNKNQILLINIVKDLLKESKNIHLLLPGVDSYNGYYQQKVKELNLEKNIHFLGYRKDIPQLLKISDLAVSSSLREGLPVNIMEAFATGLPVVALKCRGMNDLIQNGKNGYIVTNKKEFIEKILEIKNMSSKNQTVNSKNSKLIIKFELNKILKRYNNLLQNGRYQQKRVLHLLSSNKYSGAENVVCTIINNKLKKYNMVYCSPNGKIRNTLLNYKIKYYPIKKMSFLQVLKVVKEYKPDIIHAHDFKASCYATMFFRKHKIISHIHGNNRIMNSFNTKSLLYNLVAKRFSKIIWVSDSALNDYYFKHKILKKSIVLYNVIDNKMVEKKANSWICHEKYDLIFLGRLAYPKNPERLIEIIKLIKNRIQNISLAIVGDGEDKEKIMKLVAKYNLEKNVFFYGFQINPYPILKQSKILIMTSIYEGTPMCALEAQLLGKPVVATPVDGLKKIIKNNVNGFLSSNNNEIVEFIVNSLNNPQKMRKFEKNSKEIMKRCDITTYMKKIAEIYSEVI